MKILICHPEIIKNDTFVLLSSHLKKLGHNITDEDDKSGKSGKTSYPAKIDQNIKNTDILIVEISNADLKVGYLIANALSEKKVVIALEKEGIKNKTFIHETNSKNLIITPYNESEIITVVESAIEEAKKRLDTKFILIISPEIDRYLDWAGQNKRMHKAQIVRNAIESAIKKDREYKEYIGGE